MTRFKELRRLERAIKDMNEDELRWASEWCNQGFSSSTMKHHQKHWRKLKKRVDTAISELND